MFVWTLKQRRCSLRKLNFIGIGAPDRYGTLDFMLWLLFFFLKDSKTSVFLIIKLSCCSNWKITYKKSQVYLSIIFERNKRNTFLFFENLLIWKLTRICLVFWQQEKHEWKFPLLMFGLIYRCFSFEVHLHYQFLRKNFISEIEIAWPKTFCILYLLKQQPLIKSAHAVYCPENKN
jgi:hypothetical protein